MTTKKLRDAETEIANVETQITKARAKLATLRRRLPLDLSGVGLGQRTVGWFLTGPGVANIHMHCGEISCLKGIQGAHGYPA